MRRLIMKPRALVFILPSFLVVLLISSCATRLYTSLQLGGDYARVKRLIEKGADVNAQTSFGTTPLMVASAYGYTDIVKLLIEEGAYVNAQTKHGDTALMAASEMGYIDIVKLLLEAGVDVNATREDYERSTALMYASEMGHPEVVELLIEKGVDINAKEWRGWTALMIASERGHIDVAKLLIEAGADMNAMSIMYKEGSGYGKLHKDVRVPGGYTALMAASEKGHIDVVKLLIEVGADVNAQEGDYGDMTPLKYASREGHTEIVKLLYEAGAIR
jgi:serine/threonine-protein phosphatase 6 regulatory ankyrin repeat subunit B